MINFAGALRMSLSVILQATSEPLGQTNPSHFVHEYECVDLLMRYHYDTSSVSPPGFWFSLSPSCPSTSACYSQGFHWALHRTHADEADLSKQWGQFTLLIFSSLH